MGNASRIQEEGLTADPKPESLRNPVSKPPAYCGRARSWEAAPGRNWGFTLRVCSWEREEAARGEV